jgi:hypothetical protein
MIYDARLYEQFPGEINTAVIYTGDRELKEVGPIQGGSLNYSPEIITLKTEGIEAVLHEEERKVLEKKQPDILKVLFSPLMVDRDRVEDTVKKAVKIIKKMEGEDRDRDKLLAALIVLVDKLVDENTLEKLWEEFSMLNFFRFAEKKFREEGLREGMKEGMKEGIREGIVEVIFRQLKKKFGDVPQDYRLKIRSLDKESLTELSENILDINSLDDIDKFLNLKH